MNDPISEQLDRPMSGGIEDGEIRTLTKEEGEGEYGADMVAEAFLTDLLDLDLGTVFMQGSTPVDSPRSLRRAKRAVSRNFRSYEKLIMSTEKESKRDIRRGLTHEQRVEQSMLERQEEKERNLCLKENNKKTSNPLPILAKAASWTIENHLNSHEKLIDQIAKESERDIKNGLTPEQWLKQKIIEIRKRKWGLFTLKLKWRIRFLSKRFELLRFW